MPPAPEINDQLNRIGVMPRVLSADQCARAIALAQRHPAQEGRVGGKDEVRAEVRRSSTWFFDPSAETREFFDAIHRVVSLMNRGYRLDLAGFASGCQIACYTEGVRGHYDWHSDLGYGPLSRRKLSISVQLSAADAYEGGDLEFHMSDLDAVAMRQQGTLIAFPSFLEHRVAPVTRGERYSMVVWVDGPPYR